MLDFVAWYFNFLCQSVKDAFSVQKSVPGWIAMGLSVLTIGGMFLPVLGQQTDISEETKKNVGLAAAIGLFMIFLVFAPLWYAFQESKVMKEKLSDGPLIRMDDVRLDNRYDENVKLFEVRVKNDGGMPAVGRAFAVRLEDKFGERIERIDEPIELHWRGFQGDKKTFYGDIDAYAGILLINKADPNREFFLMQLKKPLVQHIPLLSKPVISYKNQEIILTIRVVFFDPQHDTPTATKQMRISIKPDSTSEIGYKVSSV